MSVLNEVVEGLLHIRASGISNTGKHSRVRICGVGAAEFPLQFRCSETMKVDRSRHNVPRIIFQFQNALGEFEVNQDAQERPNDLAQP